MLLAGLLFATHLVHTDAVPSIVGMTSRPFALTVYSALICSPWCLFLLAVSGPSRFRYHLSIALNISVGRAEELSALFALLSFLSYTSAVTSAHSSIAAAVRIVLAMGLAALSLFSKEPGIIVVVINLVYDAVVVCQLDIPSALSIASKVCFGDSTDDEDNDEPSSTQSTHAKKDGKIHPKANKTAKADTANHGPGLHHIPPHVRAFLLRSAAVLLMLIFIMKGRLGLNKGETRQDAHYNRAMHVLLDLSHVIAAGNYVKRFLPRLMTKTHYTALHAWLLLFPNTLCHNWAGGAFVAVPG